jgi:hypothetical protein
MKSYSELTALLIACSCILLFVDCVLIVVVAYSLSVLTTGIILGKESLYEERLLSDSFIVAKSSLTKVSVTQFIYGFDFVQKVWKFLNAVQQLLGPVCSPKKKGRTGFLPYQH